MRNKGGGRVYRGLERERPSRRGKERRGEEPKSGKNGSEEEEDRLPLSSDRTAGIHAMTVTPPIRPVMNYPDLTSLFRRLFPPRC